MIDLYAKDYPQLKKHNPRLMSPKALKELCKQGKWQGAKTGRRWRQAILEDWAMRWKWLKK